MSATAKSTTFKQKSLPSGGFFMFVLKIFYLKQKNNKVKYYFAKEKFSCFNTASKKI
jgi:hypothetical protein